MFNSEKIFVLTLLLCFIIVSSACDSSRIQSSDTEDIREASPFEKNMSEGGIITFSAHFSNPTGDGKLFYGNDLYLDMSEVAEMLYN